MTNISSISNGTSFGYIQVCYFHRSFSKVPLFAESIKQLELSLLASPFFSLSAPTVYSLQNCAKFFRQTTNAQCLIKYSGLLY